MYPLLLHKQSWLVPAAPVPLSCASIPYICWMLLLRCCCTKAMPIGPYSDDSSWAVHPVQPKLGQSHWRLCCLIKHFLIPDTVARFSRDLQTWPVTWGRTLESSPTGTTPLTPSVLWSNFEVPSSADVFCDSVNKAGEFNILAGPAPALPPWLWTHRCTLVSEFGADPQCWRCRKGEGFGLSEILLAGAASQHNPQVCLCWQGGWHCWTSVIAAVFSRARGRIFPCKNVFFLGFCGVICSLKLGDLSVIWLLKGPGCKGVTVFICFLPSLDPFWGLLNQNPCGCTLLLIRICVWYWIQDSHMQKCV